MMEIYNIIRMPLACLLILLYIKFQIVSKKHTKTASQFTLNFVVFTAIVHLISSCVTEYTVKNRDTVPGIINEIAHIVFLLSLTLCLGLVMYFLIIQLSKRKRKPLYGAKIALLAGFYISALGQICSPIHYVDTEFGSYATGAKAYCFYAFLIYLFVMAAVLIVKYNDVISFKLDRVMLLPLFTMVVFAVIQTVYPYILLTGLAVTLISLDLMLNSDDTNVYYTRNNVIYNRQGCTNMLDELLTLQKDFKIGVYIFNGHIDDVENAVISISEKLPYKKSKLVCGLLTDNILLVIPTHSLAKIALIPDELPEPDVECPSLNYTMKTIDCYSALSVQVIFKRILSFRDAYVESLAQKDDLTNAVRRSSMLAEMEKLISDEEPFTFAMLDIDAFKAINDTHGHQVGDAVLQITAKALHSLLRANTDIVCRMGGDEFAVVIPGLTSTNRIIEIFTHLKQQINPFTTLDGQPFEIKYSVGLCVSGGKHENIKTFQEVYAIADSLLYAAKSYGKDCLCTSKDEPPIKL